jgi:P27 family predicted phage terminase small subunit
MPQLEADGLLDAKFAGGLAAIASVYAIMAMAMKQLEKDGITVADPDHPAEGDGNEGKKRAAVRKHPLISVVMAASEKLTTWSKEFGLTPAACKRLMEEEAPGRKRGGGKLGRFLAE